ncbi:MAG TPA: DUF1080 domain-containing protein, partial [Vicinamibacteria bacterium]
MTIVLAVLLAAGPGEWSVLFDGRSTDAWRGYNRDSFPAGCWSVQDGTLRTLKADRPCEDLITKEKYRDFELELEYKLSPGGNSGVLYRVAELPAPEPAWHSGPELQILDDDKYRQNSPKNWTGALYDMIAARDATVRPVGEWNQVRLVAQGNHVEHWLNGK